jgi:hypothetical protein
MDDKTYQKYLKRYKKLKNNLQTGGKNITKQNGGTLLSIKVVNLRINDCREEQCSQVTIQMHPLALEVDEKTNTWHKFTEKFFNYLQLNIPIDVILKLELTSIENEKTSIVDLTTPIIVKDYQNLVYYVDKHANSGHILNGTKSNTNTVVPVKP